MIVLINSLGLNGYVIAGKEGWVFDAGHFWHLMIRNDQIKLALCSKFPSFAPVGRNGDLESSALKIETGYAGQCWIVFGD